MNNNKKLAYINMNTIKKNNAECIICLENIDCVDTYVKCTTCHKPYHLACFDTWNSTKKDPITKCTYCQQKGLIIHQTNTECCSCCFPLCCPSRRTTYKTSYKYEYESD